LSYTGPSCFTSIAFVACFERRRLRMAVWTQQPYVLFDVVFCITIHVVNFQWDWLFIPHGQLAFLTLMTPGSHQILT